MGSTAHWAFVCNPNKWKIDEFLRHDIDEYGWGIDRRAVHLNKRFREGQLAVVRVGQDKRKILKPLNPGVYALCEILARPPNTEPFYDDLPQSPIYKGSGEHDRFTYDRTPIHPKGWPTVRVRYLRKYLSKPLLIDDLPHDLNDTRLRKGPRSASIRIPDEDFAKILSLLTQTEDTLRIPSVAVSMRADEVSEDDASKLGDEELRQRAREAAQGERKLTFGYYFPRNGYVAAYVKRVAKGICDLCRNPAPFNKPNEIPYLECHHIRMIAEGGADTLENAVALCPNCHRRVHILKLVDDNKRLRQRIHERDGRQS